MDLYIKKRNIYTFIFLLIYRFVLDFVYAEFVHKLFSYERFSLDFNLNKYLVSLVYFFVIYYILPKDNKKPSSVFLQLHFIIMIMPMFTMYALANESNIFMMLCCVFFIMECLIFRAVPNLKIIKIKNSKKLIYFIIILSSSFVYFSMIKANGIPSLKALNLNKVYEVRAMVKYPFLMAYLVPWQAKIVNPFLITTSYIKRNRIVFFFSIFLQILLYLIAAHKTFLFIPLAIIIVLIILKKKDFFSLGSCFAPLGEISAFLVHKVFNNIIIPSIVIRRFLFVPAQLRFFFYDFFSKHEFLYFSEGTIGKVLNRNSPYSIRAAYMIGGLYFDNFVVSANTGYLADAYANMGVFGMFIMSLLFSFILIFINSVSKNIDKELVIGMCLFSILSLNDGALLTNLLTGGMLLLLILLYLYSNIEEERVQNRNEKNCITNNDTDYIF